MLRKPRLKAEDKVARLQWGRDHMQWLEQWSRTIFSDEKKFNLDGPDGWAYYWHDLRKEKRVFSKRGHGGGSLMIWIGVSKNFKSDLYVLDGTLNAVKYQALLETSLLPLVTKVNEVNAQGAIFQHDKAKAHAAKSTSAWLLDHNITTLDWVVRSPDLNITENLFGVICRQVYKDYRQFCAAEELRDVIRDAWQAIDQNFIDNLFDSIEIRGFNHY